MKEIWMYVIIAFGLISACLILVFIIARVRRDKREKAAIKKASFIASIDENLGKMELADADCLQMYAVKKNDPNERSLMALIASDIENAGIDLDLLNGSEFQQIDQFIEEQKAVDESNYAGYHLQRHLPVRIKSSPTPIYSQSLPKTSNKAVNTNLNPFDIVYKQSVQKQQSRQIKKTISKQQSLKRSTITSH